MLLIRTSLLVCLGRPRADYPGTKGKTSRCRLAAGAAGMGSPQPVQIAELGETVPLRRRCRRQRYRGLGGKQQKGERLLQVEADGGIGVAEIADREILADMQVEIAASGG